jgi:ABC-2 type transport system ATP-binding protein
MSAQEPTLLLERVTKSFDGFIAVDDLSLAACSGRIYGLIGPNGAGKTTTLRMIVNITIPDSGRIELFGRPMGTDLQDRIGYLPEERGLYKRMKVGDQLKFFGALKSLSAKTAEVIVNDWLAKLGLTEWKDKKAKELSKGMQQKIQFIAAVMHSPDLIILDEPFSGLDPVNLELMKDAVLELKTEGKTIIFSTHQMEVAEELCDDVCLLNHARKILDGSLREVKRSFGRNSVALRIEGGEEALDDPSLVTKVERHSDEMEALLAKNADPQDLLHRLLATGAKIMKFELVEPSLNDIFIEKVTASA